MFIVHERPDRIGIGFATKYVIIFVRSSCLYLRQCPFGPFPTVCVALRWLNTSMPNFYGRRIDKYRDELRNNQMWLVDWCGLKINDHTGTTGSKVSPDHLHEALAVIRI